tara:strand:+ start:1081 stop:1473 length:393 start_codon:yes stop_codon:yes gene_type:complete
MPITVEDIKKIEKSRRDIKKEIYTKIHEQLSRKIKVAVDFNLKQVFLRIPTYMLGYPTYNIKKAGDYIERQFKLGGFTVRRLSVIDLYVTWIKKEPFKPKKQRPPPEQIEDDSLPTLINLKKLASKYKNA